MSIGALPLTSNLSRIRSATLPSALCSGRFCGPVHVGVRTARALPSPSRALKLEEFSEMNTRIGIATSRSMEKRGSRARSETSMNPAGTRCWRTTTCGTLTLVVARGNRRTFQQGQLQDGLDHAAFDEDPPCATCCTPLPQRQKHHELT